MNWSFRAGRGIAAAGLMLLAWGAQAQSVPSASRPDLAKPAPVRSGQRWASVKVQAFDASSWAQLLRQGPRPMAYLFTTSYCSTCPQAFAALHQAVRQSGRPVELAAVMMDVEGEQALRHARHFQGLTQLYAFDGFEPAIRESVDPTWPNVTPYVVMIDRQGQLQRTLGMPTAAMLKNWLP